MLNPLRLSKPFCPFAVGPDLLLRALRLLVRGGGAAAAAAAAHAHRQRQGDAADDVGVALQDRHAADTHGRGGSTRWSRHDALHADRHRGVGRVPEGAQAAAARHELKMMKTVLVGFHPEIQLI